MYHRAKTDDNATAIADALRAVGAVVWFIEGAHGSAGVPDLLVGFRGKTFLLEVKMPRGTVSDAQRKFFEKWSGATAVVVRDVDEALKAIGVTP